MSRFFSSENKFFSTMSKVFDLMMLSLMWLVFSALGLLFIGVMMGNKIVTPGTGAFVGVLIVGAILTGLLGPASTAFYYTMVKVIRRERSYLFKEFFRSFRLNFRQGFTIGIVYVVLAFIAYFDFSYALEIAEKGEKMGSMMFGAFLVLTLFAVFSIIYIFPLLSRFTVTTFNLIKWAFFMSIRHIGWTLVLTVLFAGSAFLLWGAINFMQPLVVFIPGIYTLVASFPIERIFKKYMPVEEIPDEESGVDHWYNE